MTDAPKYTQEGLPIVSEETYDVFFRDTSKRRGYFDQSCLGTMERDNPVLQRFIRDFSQDLREEGVNEQELEEYVTLMIQATGVTYELLRRQAEINKLEAQANELP